MAFKAEIAVFNLSSVLVGGGGVDVGVSEQEGDFYCLFL
jgi:hypothetical protein